MSKLTINREVEEFVDRLLIEWAKAQGEGKLAWEGNYTEGFEATLPQLEFQYDDKLTYPVPPAQVLQCLHKRMQGFGFVVPELGAYKTTIDRKTGERREERIELFQTPLWNSLEKEPREIENGSYIDYRYILLPLNNKGNKPTAQFSLYSPSGAAMSNGAPNTEIVVRTNDPSKLNFQSIKIAEDIAEDYARITHTPYPGNIAAILAKDSPEILTQKQQILLDAEKFFNPFYEELGKYYSSIVKQQAVHKEQPLPELRKKESLRNIQVTGTFSIPVPHFTPEKGRAFCEQLTKAQQHTTIQKVFFTYSEEDNTITCDVKGAKRDDLEPRGELRNSFCQLVIDPASRFISNGVGNQHLRQ